MARRKGKVYSSPKGYKASLTLTDEEGRRRRAGANAWGASRVPSDYKPGAGAPRFPGFKPTETEEDMDARREAADKRLGQLMSGNDSVGMPPQSDLAEVLSAVKSHGTVEASQYGDYSGRTVQSASEKLDGGLTDKQKAGVEKSVNAEIGARLEAKRAGAVYTGARSQEEQRWQNIDYQNGLVSSLTQTLGSEEKAREEAKERLGDRWVEPPATGTAPQPDGLVTRTFAPGVGGYTVQTQAGQGAKPAGTAATGQPQAKQQSEVDKAIADAEGLVANLDEKYGSGRQKPAVEADPEDEDNFAFGTDDDGTRGDVKGGRSSAYGSAPGTTQSPDDTLDPGHDGVLRPSMRFADPHEAAVAVSSEPDMDYADLVSAAHAVAFSTSADGAEHDPEAVFHGVLAPRIEADLLAGIASMRTLEDEASARYHGANSRAVMQACGATEAEYGLAADMASAGDPSELLRMQMKFMDSF